MKRKRRYSKKKQEIKKIRFVESVHRQFFQRMHDLDYLQWMQRNGVRYVGAICLFAALFSVSVYMLQTESNQPVIVSNAGVRDGDAKNPDFQHKTAKPEEQHAVSDVEQIVPPAIVADDLQNVSKPDMLLESKSEEKTVYLNPLHLSGYQAPCGGMLVYNYGLGYDPVYEDYRFHDAICYDSGNGPAFACVDGIVAQVQMEQHWQIAIQTQRGILKYSGLDTCTATVGSAVAAGEQIGTAKEKLYIQVEKNDV